MSSYQIAFRFTQPNAATALAVTMAMTGDSAFLSGSQYTQQLFPYAGQYIPALIGTSFSGSSMQITAAPPASSADTQSLEFVTWVTAKGNGLTLNLDMRGDVEAQYCFLGAQGAGALVPGANTIPFPIA